MAGPQTIKLLKQDGGSPAPATDTLLDSTTNFPGMEYSFPNVDLSAYADSRITLYTVVQNEDDSYGTPQTLDLGVLPIPMTVSTVTDWTVGEMDEVTLGEIDSA